MKNIIELNFMKQFHCPKCNIIDSEPDINNDEEERSNIEKNYNEKVEEFKKIIEEHNKLKNKKKNRTFIQKILGKSEDSLPLDINKHAWSLYTVNIPQDNGRITTFSGIADVEKSNSLVAASIHTNSPLPLKPSIVRLEYEVQKHDKYKFIQCKNCGYKQYF